MEDTDVDLNFEKCLDVTELNGIYAAEINLQTLDTCEKYPNHKKFIAADKFTLLDLPNSYQEKKVFDFIKISSDLTVRINVAHISIERPQYFPDMKRKYPGYEYRGEKFNLTGSGLITKVFRMTGESRGLCLCSICRAAEEQNSSWAEVWIETAAHVVYDNHEAATTSCRLFFDEQKSTRVIVEGIEVIDTDYHKDWCTLICTTCSEDLIQILEDKLKVFKQLNRGVFCTVEKPLPEEKLFVSISHPHGAPKHITLGELKRITVHEDFFTQHFYDTPTCPGSSGCPIIVFGCIGWYSGIIHSGTHKGFSQLINFSTIGYEFLFQPLLSGNNSIVQREASDNNHTVSSNDALRNTTIPMEIRELKDVGLRCSKYQDHEHFTAVKDFQIEKDVKNYQDLAELITFLCDSTIQISVNYISQDRPEYLPGMDSPTPFPFYQSRGRFIRRLASGFVYDIIKYTNGFKSCPCEKCHASPNPNKTWYEIIVLTAAHALFDDKEAKHAKCKFFYDDGNSALSFESNIVKVRKCFPKEDICVFSCITCDSEVAGKISEITEEFRHYKDKAYQKYCRDEKAENLFIIVSHPHGLPKHICVGTHEETIPVGTLNYRYHYNTCTCAGCSGAYVFKLKVRHVTLHQGSTRLGDEKFINRSSAHFST